ncbi:TetR/AcrR family transcriptional regulator [Nonomuraea guangzhouensis]|uniref:TetR/AcrR family transcriptional regulator n=1 Tax=Nonomuraea guangzhouensis TaxID=1291555 RepID=A0ABW4GEY5_9ACTN|nr:TetR/AcrR family transcriptional regulator [Nonomuraea guangzhouensis]
MGRPREFSDQAVVDAAMAVFWEKGYEATTTQDLCERTGLGRGSLYNAFGSKHRLYEEAIRRYAATRADAQLAMLADPEAGSVRERLREMMLGVIDADLADPGRRGCLALNAATEPSGRTEDVAALVRRQFVDLEQAICHLVTVGQRTGELSADRPPLQVARTFQSAYYGLRVLAKVTDDRKALLDVVDGALAAL